MKNQKTPPSQMIRVPTALIPAVRELSRLHREGHTCSLQQALEDLILAFDSNSAIKALPANKSIQNLENRLDTIEINLLEKISVVSLQLEKLSRSPIGGKNRGNYLRNTPYPVYEQQQVQSEPWTAENLAKRLGLTVAGLENERGKLSNRDFISYTRHRDPRSFGWEYCEQDGLYHPVPQ
jgi:hypothetical protein